MRRRNLMALILLVPFLRELVREAGSHRQPSTGERMPHDRGADATSAADVRSSADTTTHELPPATVERVLRAVHYEEYEQ